MCNLYLRDETAGRRAVQLIFSFLTCLMPFTQKICFLDCFSGISGDMFLGALIHAGLSEDFLRETIARLRLPG